MPAFSAGSFREDLPAFRDMTLLAATSADYWPFVVLAVSVAFIILAISVLRVHAFIALVFAALLACLMAGNETCLL